MRVTLLAVNIRVHLTRDRLRRALGWPRDGLALRVRRRGRVHAAMPSGTATVGGYVIEAHHGNRVFRHRYLGRNLAEVGDELDRLLEEAADIARQEDGTEAVSPMPP